MMTVIVAVAVVVVVVIVVRQLSTEFVVNISRQADGMVA